MYATCSLWFGICLKVQVSKQIWHQWCVLVSHAVSGSSCLNWPRYYWRGYTLTKALPSTGSNRWVYPFHWDTCTVVVLCNTQCDYIWLQITLSYFKRNWTFIFCNYCSAFQLVHLPTTINIEYIMTLVADTILPGFSVIELCFLIL